MTAQRVRILIAAVAAVVVLGLVVSLFLYVSNLRPYEPLTTYSTHYASTVLNISTDAGVYRERDYYVSTSSELSTPSNGELLINPVQLPDDETEVPSVQLSSYTVTNTVTTPLFTRLTNSKRSEEREGTMPEAAVFSLEYEQALQSGSWQALTLYNTEKQEELVDSALIFAPSTPERATTWEDEVSLYLVDGALTNHAAALLPGVNILNESNNEGQACGVLYTNRSLALGSTPSREQDQAAVEALEEEALLAGNDISTLLAMDISQRITGTDLIFTAPEGKQTLSSIQAPVSRSGRGNTFTLEDGVIAIDEGATLVVGSGTVGSRGPLSEDTLTQNTSSAEGTIELSPRALIVDGGSLVLSDTSKHKIVLNTSIQVRNGGTLQIGNNVEINGNIYVFGGAKLEVLGNFTLNGEALPLGSFNAQTGAVDLAPSNSQESLTTPGGIFIFNNNSLQIDGTPLGSGFFDAQVLWLIDGDDGRSPILKSKTVHFLSAEGPPGYLLMYNEYSCSKAEGSAWICGHFGDVEGVISPEIRVSFSTDLACVEALFMHE